MRVLIDECIDERLRNYVWATIAKPRDSRGWPGLNNGDLLSAAEDARFDVFLTVDQSIEYQQNSTGRAIAIIIVGAKSNRLGDLLPHMPACLVHFESIQPGQIVRVGD